jgi:hypothetical protein
MDECTPSVTDKLASLRCPHCKVMRPSFVTDSRVTQYGTIRRRRRCGVCNKRFSTIEQVLSTHLTPPVYAAYDDDLEASG